MPLKMTHLGMKRVVNGNVRAFLRIYRLHERLKIGPMPVPIQLESRRWQSALFHKKVRMNHFMQKRRYGIRKRAELQQRAA